MTVGTREKLLDVAEEVARAHGYDGFSYADLSRTVGIRKASIHYHFETKGALVGTLIARYREKMDQDCAAIAAAKPSDASRLDALVKHYRAACESGESLCLCVALSINPTPLPEEVIAELRAFRRMMVGWITAFIGETAALDEGMAKASAILAQLEGAQLAARAEQSIERFDLATSSLA